MNEEYGGADKSAGVGTAFNVLGILALVFAVIGGVLSIAATSAGAFSAAAGVGIGGVLFLGVGEVLARMAAIREALVRIEWRLVPVETPKFFYIVGEEVRGPLSLADLRTMRAAPMEMRMVTGETMVCAQGGKDWKRLADVSG